MADQKIQKVNINGTEYNLADLNKDVKTQLMNVSVAEQEIEQLNRKLAIAKTAKNAYTGALKQAMEKMEKKEETLN